MQVGRLWGSRAMRAVLYLVGLLVAFFLGIVAVNYVILPGLTSRGPTTVVPDLVGMEVSVAQRLLEGKDLELRIQGKRFDNAVPEGAIVSQEPPAQHEVKKGRAVSVVVSRGPESLTVPDVKGFSLRQGQALLEEAGMGVRGTRYEVSDLYPQGQVIGMDPPAGSRVPRGTNVLLAVSLGPVSMEMPLLEERSLAEAERLLRAMGLGLGRVEYVEDAEALPGTVLGQDPPAGSHVVKGDRVNLVVAGPGR